MSRNPFDDIERMFDRMSSRLEPFDEDVFEGSVAIDVEDTEDGYVVTADLPGFDREDIDVELAGDRLTLSATHESETEEEEDEAEGRYLRRERRQRSVSRSVRLPEPVDEDAAEAEYRNGVLTVTLPKEAESDSGHDIPIN